MVNQQRRRLGNDAKSANTKKCDLQSLTSAIIGFSMGSILMYLVMATAFPASHYLDSRYLVTAGNGNYGDNTGDAKSNDGWHPIHVFYGDPSGLGADPQQKSYAQVRQDEIVLDLIGTSGYFIDLAANDALEWSNTLALEKHKGWKGLCIEPNPTYWYGLSHRRCTVVGALVGDTVKRVDVKFRGVYGGILGRIDEKKANYKKEPNTKVEQRYTVPIRDVLERFHVPKVIDYLSLDIEGAEYLVMQHFPFDDYQIKLLTVERPDKDLKTLFAEKGYIHLKDLTWWGETLWAHKTTGYNPDHPMIQKIKTEERN